MKQITAHPLHLVLGLVVWSVWFVALYGGLSVACEVAPPAAEAGALTWINASLLVLTLATTGVLLLLAWASLRAAPALKSNRRFILRIAAAIYLLSALSALFIGLPVVILPPCV
ncbi:hypothetical protein CWE09_04235 [Aliidiomarina minuta]|uniref:Uncharacterized protein n=1 Tax=Aliidiomarina minuta TaxID=880057 RepID=A0A432W7D2_9GAMM|nr:hypothetical protein [Aliidiomarina minuta]RUO25942.1 hypothetical protein CWE09_04235 [Aliidiomarina minuta]